ncbi:MAG: isoleucine--tRNA ligase [Chlamydiota bacterium]
MFDLKKEESFPEKELRILDFWKQEGIFEKSMRQRESAPVFSFYDGPPFATGLPHYGHLLAGTIKDVIPRYKTMQGYLVHRRFGWDCHGLPVENEIEKAQDLSGAPEIEAFGIERFNDACRAIVLRYSKEWEKTVERMGRWVTFSDAYRTMDLPYMESVWWIFQQLYRKGLVYKGFKVMPFSAKLGTPLSNFEANLNYRDVQDPSLTVQFSLKHEPETYFLAWTTTPWTLISNLALIVHPEELYVKVTISGKKGRFLLAKSCLSRIIKEEYQIVEECVGSALEGTEYLPLFPYFQEMHPAFSVLCDSFVTTDEGTGIVHAAPAFGEVDFFACQKAGIGLVCPVDLNGKFTADVPEFAGLFVKDTDQKIIKHLVEEGKIFHKTQISHRYPFCWRSDTPLIYRAVSTWFIAVEKIKESLLSTIEEIRFVPDHIKTGRFGKWIENARDWAVSRNRYWGTPLPIWESLDGEDHIVLGSKEELETATATTIADLHRQHIDELVIEKGGKKYRRVQEVFDCWFESGCMPYAQNHYPFAGTRKTEESFPADFIAEGLDQTRGWFYTLSVIGAALFEKPAFKNVVVNGIVLAENGEKMSKSRKNYPAPERVIEKYGADAIRLYLLKSPAVRADDLRFSSEGVELVLRQILLPFYNSYVFLATYAAIYQWEPGPLYTSSATIDRWILSKTEGLIESVQKALDSYELNRAVRALLGFFEELTNWYIRRSRTRFWQDEETEDRKSAFSTLYFVLFELTKITAPFLPFLSEAIYQELRTSTDAQSVHLCDYPTYRSSLRNFSLEQEMDLVQKAVSLGHAVRKECKIKVRQPLGKATIALFSAEMAPLLSQHESLIREELNVKELEIQGDDTAFVDYLVSPNFPVLGKKVGQLIPAIQKEMRSWSQETIKAFLRSPQKSIHLNSSEIFLEKEDFKVTRRVKKGGQGSISEELYIAFNTQLDESLILEGTMREVINKINLQRKELGLAVTDRIHLSCTSTPTLSRCFAKYEEHIQHEVLAEEVTLFPTLSAGKMWEIQGEKVQILIEKAPTPPPSS